MRLNDETYEYIKQAVADMFVTYDIKGIPINAFEVAIKIGLNIIPYSSLSYEKLRVAYEYSEDGYSIEENDGTWNIYYNDITKDYTRINQTIMHEVGHFILGHIEEGEEEEAEAKFFAKYALASPALIQNLLSVKNVENIMNTFDIGYKAACIALDNHKKRFAYGRKDYTDYEMQILNQLEVEIVKKKTLF